LVLGFELKACTGQAGTLPLESQSQSFFVLVIFQVGSHIFFGAQTLIFPPMASCITWIVGICHHDCPTYLFNHYHNKQFWMLTLCHETFLRFFDTLWKSAVQNGLCQFIGDYAKHTYLSWYSCLYVILFSIHRGWAVQINMLL
jgi:hypothetical protein